MLSNEAIFNDTLRIIEDGYYTKDEQLVMLKYSTEESQESIVILPDEIKQIYNKCFVKGNKYSSDCNSKCFNLDSFSLGIKTKKIIILTECWYSTLLTQSIRVEV